MVVSSEVYAVLQWKRDMNQNARKLVFRSWNTSSVRPPPSQLCHPTTSSSHLPISNLLYSNPLQWLKVCQRHYAEDKNWILLSLQNILQWLQSPASEYSSRCGNNEQIICTTTCTVFSILGKAQRRFTRKGPGNVVGRREGGWCWGF